MLSLSKLQRIHQRVTVSSSFGRFQRFLSTQPIPSSTATTEAQAFDNNDQQQIPSSSSLTTEEFRKLHQINLICKNNGDYPPITSFESTPFAANIKKVFNSEGYTEPTPTQAQSWPIVLQKKDLISIAKTGSGKTCGFLLPAFHFMAEAAKSGNSNTQTQAAPPSSMSSYQRGGSRQPLKRRQTKVLVIAPTRELSVQITNEAEKFARACGLKTACLYGGVSRSAQIEMLRQGVEVIVATPGRANDLIEAGFLDLSQVHYFVMDEADRMLDMGFEPQIRQIISQLPAERQTLFFTATWPKSVQSLASEFLKSPVMLQIGDTNRLNANKAITQSFLVVKPFERDEKLHALLQEINEDPQKKPQNIPKTIIFRSRKDECDMLCDQLYHMGYAADSLHGDKSQAFRDRVMQNFRSGRIRVLVATDVAARGLDVKDINVVINYDFPDKGVEDYVHRIGRTARGGQSGMSFTFVTQKDARSGHLTELIDLVKRSGQQVPQDLVSLEAAFSRRHDSHAHGALGRNNSSHHRSGSGGYSSSPRQYGSGGGGGGSGGGWKFGASRSAPSQSSSYGNGSSNGGGYGNDSYAGLGGGSSSSRFRSGGSGSSGGYSQMRGSSGGMGNTDDYGADDDNYANRKSRNSSFRDKYDE